LADRIVQILGGIVVSIPLFAFIYFLVKLLLKAKMELKLTTLAKVFLAIFFIITSLMLIILVFNTLIFHFFDISIFWKIIGLIFFLLYYGVIFGSLGGLGNLGTIGVSPNQAISNLIDLINKSNNSSTEK
jgi:hypothetical protein